MADAPRKKKLPFKPTALRMAAPTSQADNDANDDLDLFKRSKEMAPIVAAEQMRRWKKKQRQMEEEEERRRSSAGSKHALGDDDEDDGEDAAAALDANEEEDDDIYEAPSAQQAANATDEGAADNLVITPPPSKRSRLTTSASSSHRGPKQDTNSLDNSPSSRRTRSRAAAAAATAAAPSTASSSEQLPTATEIVTLDSDSEPEITTAPSPQPASRHGLVEEDPLELNDAPSDDDEFAEYVRRAEQQRARDLASQTSLSASALTTETPPPKEIVEIIITSDLAASKPCLIKFLFDRPLRLVRDSWIALQRKHRIPLPVEQDDDVVLTWRRRRVYMFSTLLNLGIRPKGDGTVVVDGTASGAYNREGLAEARTRVHMEAWTPELFAQMERDEELRRKREAGELDDDYDDDDDDELDTRENKDTHDGAETGQGEGGEEQVKLRIILKPKDLEPVKLLVRPETTVETLLTAFRTQRDVGGDGAEVALWFDGMRLDEDTTMEDAEIDDMDTIEVHIK